MTLVLIVLRRAMQVAGKVAQPISALLPDALAGASVATGIAVLLLVLVSFLAGLVARTIPAGEPCACSRPPCLAVSRNTSS